MTKTDKINLLKERVNAFFKVDITTKSRENDEVYARAVYYHICKILDSTMTTGAIGNTVNRSHSTVIYTLNKFKIAYEYDKKFKQVYDDFIAENPVYLKEYLSKRRNTKDIVNIIDFICSLDIIERMNFINDVEKLKLTYKHPVYEGVL
jgi:hypothetical protein